MEAALTDALNWLETGGGDVVRVIIFLINTFDLKVTHDDESEYLFD